MNPASVGEQALPVFGGFANNRREGRRVTRRKIFAPTDSPIISFRLRIATFPESLGLVKNDYEVVASDFGHAWSERGPVLSLIRCERTFKFGLSIVGHFRSGDSARLHRGVA